MLRNNSLACHEALTLGDDLIQRKLVISSDSKQLAKDIVDGPGVPTELSSKKFRHIL
jgi:hypothetical protein